MYLPIENGGLTMVTSRVQGLMAGSVCNDDSRSVHIRSKTICVVYAAVAWVLKISLVTLTGRHSCFQVTPATGGLAQRGTSASAAL